MTDRPSPRQFETEILIAAPRDVVWNALTEARELARWFAPHAEVDPGVGGTMLWQWGELHSWPLRIEAWEPGEHLRTVYDSKIEDGRGGRVPLLIDFHLSGAGGTTTLRLVHSGFGSDAAFDDEYDGISRGWPIELHSLRLYLERHRGHDRAVAFARASTEQAPAEAWRALCGPQGLGFTSPVEALTPGKRWAMSVRGAGALEGVTLCRPTARDFSGTVANLNDGFFHLWLEQQGGTTAMWVWLAAYDVPQADVDRWQSAFAAAIQRVFPQARFATAGGSA